MIHIPTHIKSLKPYIPGKPIRELEREYGIADSIKLASNENPIGPSRHALKALRGEMRELNRYPDGNCFYLKKAISEKLHISPEEIIFGNGSNEIIELAVRTFLVPGDEAIAAHPSFVVYPMTVQAAQGRSIMVPLKDWRHDLEEMASRITEKTKIIFIANPNNPTGTITTDKEMQSFLSRVPDHVLIIVDEAYHEYVSSLDYADSMKYMRMRNNMVILRTFSKAYGLAGLRIGYGLSRKKIITEMNKIRQPFNVNTLAQTAAIAALNDQDHLGKTLRINEKGKAYLYNQLRALDIDFVPTEANFIYIPLPNKKAVEIYDKLLHLGVIIRPLSTSSLRITIGRPRDNRVLINALKRIVSIQSMHPAKEE